MRNYRRLSLETGRALYDMRPPQRNGDAILVALHGPALATALGNLDERQQTIIRLRYWEGLTFEAIGARLPSSHGGTLTHERVAQLHRGALARLRGAIRWTKEYGIGQEKPDGNQ
jgi:DNA-directed RNA polymerase specialized sigma subunit